jgi:hypothetical protein
MDDSDTQALARSPGALKLPRHISLSIQHNPHRGDYRTIERWVEDHLLASTAGTGFTADEVIRPEDRAAILATGEVWVISWCPETPVGSCEVVAATLERALELAGVDSKFDLAALWRSLTDEQRHQLATDCCRGCGSLDTGCQCWNDD